ncbi:MAG: hypothetical protein J6B98_03105 [Bacilli bacterium]|nr:hypothetical protein [Bacilli bacterium]
MNAKFIEFRKKYKEFIYKKYEIIENEEEYKITYFFEIPNLKEFTPYISINKKDILNKNINQSVFKNLVFNIGMVELLSYLKATCSPKIVIEAGYLNEDQVSWWKKLYYYGLGEFLYSNNIGVSEDDLFNFEVRHVKEEILKTDYEGIGNLIPIGGGKDSNVTLELLKDYDNTPIAINPKQVHLDCIAAGGYNNIFGVKRVLDKGLLELNEQGFLNGHTPFSALVSFVTYLCAYLSNKKYIVLSNEASANEATVLGTNVNHQYSKSYEYEFDFNNYADKYLGLNIKYFSLLRALNETQIAYLFSKYKNYHKVFKSCNVGSKSIPWKWCGDCPKCLFVYIILSPYLNDEELINIFGENLYKKGSLLITFKELLGLEKTKPFECVGTTKEVRDAVSKAIKNRTELPYLLKYYKDNYPLEEYPLLDEYNEENFIPEEYQNILKEELKNV